MNATPGPWYSASETDSAAIHGHLSTEPGLAPAPPKGRRADRVPIELGAGLRQRGAAGVSVQIMDLSTDGFRVATHLELSVGSDVWLRLPGLEPSHARVAWASGHYVGCAFVRPLHPAVLQMIVDKASMR